MYVFLSGVAVNKSYQKYFVEDNSYSKKLKIRDLICVILDKLRDIIHLTFGKLSVWNIFILP